MGAAGAIDPVIQYVLAALMIEVIQPRRNQPAFVRNIGAGQDLVDVHVHEDTGLVVDHRGGGLDVGKRRASDEEGSYTED